MLSSFAFPQLDRVLSRAQRMDIGPGNSHFQPEIWPRVALGKLPRQRGHRPQSDHESGTHHFGGLEPLGTFGNFEPDRLTLIERTEAVPVNRAVMDKDFLAIVHRDEAITLFGAEPLNNSGRHFPRQPPAKTKRASDPAGRCSSSPQSGPQPTSTWRMHISDS
jgi:hypothetical protein